MKNSHALHSFYYTTKRALFLTLLCSTILLNACSKSDEGPQGDGNVVAGVTNTLDACTLITRQDAESALGEPVNEPTNNATVEDSANGPVAVSTCSFGASGDYRKSLSLMVRRAQNDESDATIAILQHTYPDSQTIGGLGDKALWADHQLNVFRGAGLYVSVRVWDLADGANALTQAKGIAEKVLAQL